MVYTYLANRKLKRAQEALIHVFKALKRKFGNGRSFVAAWHLTSLPEVTGKTVGGKEAFAKTPKQQVTAKEALDQVTGKKTYAKPTPKAMSAGKHQEEKD